MKRLFITLSFIAITIANAMAANHNFSAVCNSGQTLYYKILSSVEPFTVKVTYPNYNSSSSSYYYSYTKPSGDLTIPETVIYNGKVYSVVTIDCNAFYDCNDLTSVTIPTSVTLIDKYAFMRCSSLTSIVIPNSVTTINSYAFYDCSSLTSITIPNSVTSIGAVVFFGCSKLTGINVESDNTKYTSEDGVLFNKDKTRIVCYPTGKAGTTYTIPNSVTNIDELAFYDCDDLTSVTIPTSVTLIDNRAFSGCSSLTSITIPNSVTSIGEAVFSGCSSLQSITLPFVGNQARTATDNSYIPFGYIFGTSFYLGGTATKQDYLIGNTFSSGNFYIPTTLKTVIITGSSHLPSCAFQNCSGLTSIVIPNSVTSIGGQAFYNCIHLNIYCAMEIGSKPAGWDSYGNSKTPSYCLVFWGSKFDGDFAYRVTNNELYEAEIIGYLGTDSIVEISNEIAINAFTKCKVSSISANAFRYHTNMTKIIISNTVKNIGSNAFYNCTGLNKAIIGYSVESIGAEAFSGCTGLTSIVLPISLMIIGDGAFTNCYNIESMNIKCLTPPVINSQTFLSVDKNVPVFVTCGNASVYKSTDYWKDFVTFIDNEFPYTIEVHSDDESMGNVTIRQQPSCDNTNAIIEATGTN